jgi:hypothetical protein
LLFENGKAGWDLLKGIDGEFQPEMRSGAEARVVTRGLTESHEIRGIEELEKVKEKIVILWKDRRGDDRPHSRTVVVFLSKVQVRGASQCPRSATAQEHSIITRRRSLSFSRRPLPSEVALELD